MRKLLFVFAFLIVGISMSAQTERQFNGSINIYKAFGSGPTYRVEAFYNDIYSYYASDSVQVGDFVYVTNGASCARLEITIIHSNTGGIVDITMNDVDGVMVSAPLGLSAITRETDYDEYPQDVRGIPETLQSCILNQFINLVGSKQDTVMTIVQDSIFVTSVDGTEASRDTFPRIPSIPQSIDSSFVRNDSVFVSAGGTDYFTGVNTGGGGGGNAYEVDSIAQILDGTYPDGTRIISKGLDGKGEAVYYIESDTVTGYTTDSIGVIPVSGGNYAVYSYTPIKANNFGMIGDNSTDSRDAVIKAIDFADAIGEEYMEIHNTGADTFLISRAMFLYEDNIHIQGVGNPVLRYRSAHADNYANQAYYPFSSTELNKHCFFFVENENVSVRGLSFIGDRQNHITGAFGTDTLNVGVSIYMRGVDQFRVEDCNQYNGKSLLQGEAYYDGDTTIVGHILNCRSENFFGAINPPSGTIIQNCDFIQAPSDSTYFDRIGEFGTSSAVYAFAQRRNIQIINNRFKNVRTVAIKASGSSGELSNIIIEENEFDLCGTALAIGGDSGGDGLHTGIFIRRNMFKNVAGVRAGWTLNETAIRIYGSNHVDIIDNSFAYNRDMQSLGRYAIWVQMQSTNAPPITNIRINGNRFYRIDGFDKGVRALQSENILLSNVNEYGLGTFEVKDNYDDGIASNFININRSTHGVVSGNVTRAALFGTVSNSSDLLITNNKVLSTNQLSNDRAIEYSNVGWSEDFGNEVTLNSDTLSNKSTNWIIQSEGTDRFSPIAIERTTGFAFPSEGKPTGMLFYGAGWETGDSLRIGSTWLKYNTEFSSEATLISYINASVAGIDAWALEDSTGVADGYIVLRSSSTASNGSTYRTQIRSRSNVAGVVAANNGAPLSNYGNNEIWAGGGSVNKIVLFSPIATHQVNYTLSGYDSDSNGFLSFNGQGWIDRTTKQGGVVEINTDVQPANDLKFLFKIH